MHALARQPTSTETARFRPCLERYGRLFLTYFSTFRDELMTFPTIFDWLARFEFLRGYPATVGLLLTAVLIILAWEWRLTILSLATQYLLLGLLYADVAGPQLLLGKLLIGLFVCLILFVTAQQVNWGKMPVDLLPEEIAQLKEEQRIKIGPFYIPTAGLMRFSATAVLLVVALILAKQMNSTPATAVVSEPYFELAVIGLMALGFLAVTISTDLVTAGSGLLMLFAGFELHYSAVVQTTNSAILLSGFHVLLALLISYLLQRRYAVAAIFD